MGKPLPYEEIEKRIAETKNGNVKILVFRGMNNPGMFECLVCEHRWEVKNSYDIINGKRHCPNCWNQRRGKTFQTPFSEILKTISENECRYIDGEYYGYDSELLIEFKCGHSDSVRFDVFKNSKTFLCRKCQKRKVGDQFKKSREDIEDMLSSLGLKFIEFPNGYDNGKSLVTYECEFGHIVSVQFDTIIRKKKCSSCALIKQYDDRRGKGHPLWNGGTSSISPSIKGNMLEWKKESIKKSNYQCVISGDKFQAVHHLYAFNMILEEAIENLGMLHKNFVYEYTEEDISDLILECKRLHTIYPLGVCLRKDIHILFHQLYGVKDNTPEQFYEFAERIRNGEIEID